ncbi:MAG: sensor histidine kinase [Myxococcota bacterium]
MLGGFVYAQIERRINRQATLVIEVQTRDLADALASQSLEHPPDHVLAWFERQARQLVARSPADLGLGIELLDERGRSRVAVGSLASGAPPVGAVGEIGDGATLRAVDLGGEHAHLLTTSAVAPGFLRVAIDTRRFARNVEEIRRVFLLALPLVLVATGLLGWALARASLRPIHQINRTARQIGGSNLESSIPTTGSGDELDQLAGTLNDMIGRIRGSMERERRFTGNAAHQLLTPLAAIRNQIDVTLARERSSDEYLEALEGVRGETARMAEEVEAMLRLARSEGGLPEDHREPCDVAAILRTVADFFLPLASDRGVELAIDGGSEVTVLGDESWLTQLFSNVVSNAIKYTPPGGRVTLVWRLDTDTIQVSVSDTGPGIGSDSPETVFERFHRSRSAGATPGFGLGLPIAREIARAHGGNVTIERSSAEGTTVRVTLPTAPPMGDVS